MRRAFVAVLLIITLLTATTFTGCSKKGGDATGPAIFIAAVIILGLTVGGWFDEDHEDPFPPNKYDPMPYYGDQHFNGSILSEWDKDWYRTEVLRPGERIRIWADSDIGVRASLVDERGRYISSDNWAPGSNFNIEVEATETTSYYLQVYAVNEGDQGPYTIYWKYTY